MIYVYQHIREDNGQVFYVGIGNKRRPYSKQKRNKHWHNIVNKHGYSVDIVTTCDTLDKAVNWEMFLIAIYGRNDLKSGSLTNMTDGGVGYYNPSEEFRKAQSIRSSGKNNYWYGKDRLGSNNPFYGKKNPRIAEMNKAMSGEKHPFYGKKRPEVSAMLSGANNPMFGKKRDDKLKQAVSQAQSKKVINLLTDEVYKNTIEASEKTNINVSTLRAKLNGRLKNNTPMRYL